MSDENIIKLEEGLITENLIEIIIHRSDQILSPVHYSFGNICAIHQIWILPKELGYLHFVKD